MLDVGNFNAEIKNEKLGFSLVAKAPVFSICASEDDAELNFDNIKSDLSAGKAIPLI